MSDNVPSAASAAEEWSDADFDLPEGGSLLQHLSESASSGRGTSGSTLSHLPQISTKPSRPTGLRMSTGPDELEDDDDLAAFLAEDDEDNIETIKAPRGLVTTTATKSGATTPVAGTITRLGGARIATAQTSAATDEDEDWETDLDFTATSRSGGFSKPLVTIAPPTRDLSVWDEDDDISTIKASRLPPIPAATEASASLVPVPANTPLPPSPLPSPSLSPTRAVDEDDEDSMESAFELPMSLSRLSLRPLASRSSKATLSTLSEWASDATGTTVTSATSDSFESSDNGGKFTLSASPSTDFTTDEEDEIDDEEREAKEVEGLVLPDSFLPKDLVRILDRKKKAPAAPAPTNITSSRLPKQKSKHAEEEDDFESGLLIGNDSELSPSRLLLRGGDPNGKRPQSAPAFGGLRSRLRPKMMTIPLSGTPPPPSLRSSSSRATLSRANSLAVPSTSSSSATSSSTARDAMRNARSPSPVPRRSEESNTSSSSRSGQAALTSKASTVTLRRTTKPSISTATSSRNAAPTSSSASSSRPSSSTQSRSRQLSPPPLTHSYSMLTLPRIPGPSTSSPSGSTSPTSTSPSKPGNIKHQKSTSRLLMSPKALTPAQRGTGSGATGAGAKDGAMRLGRKASLSSLVDAERARERISKEREREIREREREREREGKSSTLSSGSNSNSGVTSPTTSTASGSGGRHGALRPPSATGSAASGPRLPRYMAPTSSARAKAAPNATGSGERPSLSALFLPVPRPTTPIDSPSAIRLTMPTSSTRAKARVPVSSVFPSGPAGSSSTAQQQSASRQSSTSPVPFARVASPISMQSRVRPQSSSAVLGGGTGPKLLKKPKTARAFGDGTELDGIDDLVVEKDKERKFRVTPRGTSNGARVSASASTSTSSSAAASGSATPRSSMDGPADTGRSSVKEKRPSTGASSSGSTGTIGRRSTRADPSMTGTSRPTLSSTAASSSTSTATVTSRRPPSRASTVSTTDTPRPPSSAASVSTTGTLLRRKSRMELASSTATVTNNNTTTTSAGIRASVPLLSPAPAAAAYATLRRRRASPKKSENAAHQQRKPTLIRNLSGVGSPKVVGDMKWNPVTLRWEGNDSALRSFDSPIHSGRPALITHLTGSSVGGVGSPTGPGLLNGARVVGNMMFDPSKMCWISRFADEEEDPFAGMDEDDEFDADDDKDATLGKRRGLNSITNSMRSRSNTGNLGAPSIGTPLETVAGSPARSAASRTSHRTQHSTASESETESLMLHPPSSSSARSIDDDGDDDADDRHSASEGSPERARRRAQMRGASTSPIPGVDDIMLEVCQAAEARHRLEMKGWFPKRTRAASSASAPSSSSRTPTGRSYHQQRGASVLYDDDTDGQGVDRSYLFEIRTLATRQY